VIGREFSIATNQVDFAQPRSFDLRYKDRDNIDKIPICIHRAPLGTHERFIGFLDRALRRQLPALALAEQVRILPIGDEPTVLDYARSSEGASRIATSRRDRRVNRQNQRQNPARRTDESPYHVRRSANATLEANAVSVRVHGKGNLGAQPRDQIIAELLSSIKERRG
jgi:threonyl-tRNA synthetase